MTYLSQLDFTGVQRRNLSDDVQLQVRAWREQILEPTPDTIWGLWLFGERRAGTSYVGKAVAANLAFHHGFGSAERVTAISLMRELRATWTAGQMLRTHSDDMGLYWEATMAEEALKAHFDGDLLWIDQFHHETVDMPFWKKHIQPLIEERLDNGKPTIVSTTMAPSDPALPKGVVDGLFVPVFIDGYRP